jgi:chloramphenicol O-acetyltransferase
MDRIIEEEQSPSRLRILTWKQKEIENYLCRKETLPAYARNYGSDLEGTVFQRQLKEKREHRKRIMEEVIREMETASEKFDMNPWNGSMKVGDAFLTPLFKNYTEKLDTYNEMDKKNFHELARFVPKERIDPEVNEKLDAIAETAAAADSI